MQVNKRTALERKLFQTSSLNVAYIINLHFMKIVSLTPLMILKLFPRLLRKSK